MKLTFLLPSDYPSGGSRVTMQMGNALLLRGHAVRIAYRTPALGSYDQLVSWARAVKFAVQRVTPPRWLRCFNGKREPVRNFDDLQFVEDEVVISTGEETVGALQKLSGKVGKLRYCHGFVERAPEQMRRAWGGPIDTIAVSPALVPTLEEHCEGRVLGVVPNGMSAEEYFVEHGTRDGIGFIFSQHPLKGSDVMVRLLHALHQKWPDIPRYLFGPSRRVRELWPCDYERYPSIANARAIYNRCKVWIVASRDEGFCLPILEAMACGCAVISSRHSNASVLIEHGVNGFTVPYGDIDGYLTIAESLLNDEQLRLRIAERGLATVKQYTWDNAANRMEAAFQKLYAISAHGSSSERLAPPSG
jgi:glycosyltransferase involved in cell wall biosynthesis